MSTTTTPELKIIQITAPGIVVDVSTYAASINNCFVKDREGKLGDVVLGFSTPEDYQVPNNPGMNCVIGRVAGRIAAPGITVEGKFYPLPGHDGGGKVTFYRYMYIFITFISH